ncbi:DUF4236 domain-containing protein [Nocardioides sp. SYSU D00038]|uniref:DUF4236 domain-containing protein n=1 Tax=Nocardioides sp. SYSU D00038 TaxID=2812554 RepID=UPI0019689B1E|nr:DUF4236 domain-containing protein [Nocardioides sp. SYSU D00038]
MGFRARKSFKVMPGVRMTVSKSGISASAGVRGARVTRTASGRVTRTVGIPGSGLSHTKTVGGGGRRQAPAARPPVQSPRPVKPGLLAPKWEKELHKALIGQNASDLPRIAQTYPEEAGLVATFDGLLAMQAGENERALQACRWAWSTGVDAAAHPFVQKYIGNSSVTLSVASGVSASVPISRDALGLALAELEQEAGNLAAAIEVAEGLDPSLVAAVSLCELYLEAGRYDDVVDVSNGVRNEDDASALVVAFRAVALRELGHHTAAREAFKEALKSRSRDNAIRHYALIERGLCYLAENKKAMARKDFERVLAEDSTFPGVAERLAALKD